MGDQVQGRPSSARAPEDRLDSWKEIAAHCDRDVTTVQRWERREGMPVHRHLHDKMGSVYAFRTELDAWARSRNLQAEPGGGFAEPAAQASRPAAAAAKARRVLLLPLVGAAAVLTLGTSLWLQRTEFFWRSPLGDARLQVVTDFDGVEQAAAVSRDGRFVAFLSDRDGRMDVWVTQVGSGRFHNLTRGRAPELVNPSVRALGFSPDGSLVTFWVRRRSGSQAEDIGIWAVPTLGGQPTPYLEGAAEYDWSPDGSRLAYHTTGPGDPLYVTDGIRPPTGPAIFTAAPGLHAHFPLWAPDQAFLYFVQGSLPDGLDVWRIRAEGGSPERITSHQARVSHPVLLDHRTLAYLATDSDGSGPWLHTMDVVRRRPHRLTFGPQRFTSLAAGADGRRLVTTLASPNRTLWRLSIARPAAEATAATRISTTSRSAYSPRLGPDYLLYVSAVGANESLWKLANGVVTELWGGRGARILGGPAISPDGRQVAFSARQQERTLLYVMQADGTGARVVTDALDLRGAPAWAPDGRSIAWAADDHGVPRLSRVPTDGGSPSSMVQDYSIDPAWAPDGRLVVYSGPDTGAAFAVKAVTSEGVVSLLPVPKLTRGARHLAFLPGGRKLVHLRGEIQHKDLWVIDLETGVERQLTRLGTDFDVSDFDVSSDGREVVLERVQEDSDVFLVDLPKP